MPPTISLTVETAASPLDTADAAKSGARIPLFRAQFGVPVEDNNAPVYVPVNSGGGQAEDLHETSARSLGEAC